MSDHDVTKMKVADLKRELKSRNLSTVGNKNELAERLQSALLDGDSTLDDSALNADDILDDDVLNDDDLDDEEETSLLNDDAVLKTPPESKPAEAPVASAKKVILKRKLNVNITGSPAVPKPADSAAAIDETIVSPAKIAKTTITAPSADDSIKSSSVAATDVAADAPVSSSEDGDKKVIKLSQLTAQERLEMRAKKFGVPVTPESAKLARSQRFGIADSATKSPTAAGSVTNSASTIKANKEPASVDILKKRAERFGGSVSKAMNKIENNEKLLKRNERFGNTAKAEAGVQVAAAPKTDGTTTTTAAAAAPTAATGTVEKDEFAEKARQRLERFKTAVA